MTSNIRHATSGTAAGALESQLSEPSRESTDWHLFRLLSQVSDAGYPVYCCCCCCWQCVFRYEQYLGANISRSAVVDWHTAAAQVSCIVARFSLFYCAFSPDSRPNIPRYTLHTSPQLHHPTHSRTSVYSTQCAHSACTARLVRCCPFILAQFTAATAAAHPQMRRAVSTEWCCWRICEQWALRSVCCVIADRDCPINIRIST